MKRSLSTRGLHAFSLVEVTIAIGIASFCLLAVVGLLPVGLGTLKVSRDEAGAARALHQIAQSIRSATVDADGNYVASGAYTNVTWTTTGTASMTLNGLSLSGLPTSSGVDQRLIARVELTPPSNTSATGKALVTVAWPKRATWNGGASKWTNAQGSLSTWVIFRPTE